MQSTGLGYYADYNVLQWLNAYAAGDLLCVYNMWFAVNCMWYTETTLSSLTFVSVENDLSAAIHHGITKL